MREVIVSNTLERDWRGIVTALLVIIVMCSIIAAAVLLFTPLANGVTSTKTPLTAVDILSSNLVGSLESLAWLDATHLLLKVSQNITILDTSKDDFPSVPFPAADILVKYGRVINWLLSPDRRYIAMGFDEKKRGRYRHSQYAHYKIAWIPETQDQGVTLVKDVGPTDSEDEQLELFKWNPKSNAYVFVHENDIYYRESPESNETIQITNNGSGGIYNGISDWIYEEEIFSSSEALWWSKSGQYLAYASIDDSDVTEIEYSIFEKRQYPFTNRIPYPKTGAKNLPVVSVWIYDRFKKEPRRMKIALKNQTLTTYLLSASWIKIRNQDLLVAVFSNRYQNYVSITLCTYDSQKCVLSYDQPFKFGDRELWAEPEDFRIRHFSNDSYFVKLPQAVSDGNIYNHIARISVPANLANGRATFLPMDNYDVCTINGYDPKNKKLYYIAAAPKPSQRHLYVTPAYLGEKKNADEKSRCLSCGKFPNCTYHEASFSENINTFAVNCHGPGIQRFFVSSISSNISILKELGNYEELAEKFESKILPRSFYTNVTLRNGYVALVKMLLPQELDFDSLDQRYPAIISVYAGPGSQKVLDEYSPTSVDMLMASKHIVVYIDARGSGMRGWNYKEPLLGKFGTIEVDDQIEAIRLLAAKYRFIDPIKIGIWGWSYGGFVAAQAVERDNNKTLKCAASVAPVTNFKLYDATYTERYMGNASDLDYEKTDLSRNVTKFKNVQYLIVHGTADDNVHLQNTIHFIRTLEEQNIHFQLMIYPDGTHVLLWARFHLYTLLTEFFGRCFQ